MTTTLTAVPTLRTNLADYAVTKAMKDGRVKSDIVNARLLRADPGA